MTMQAGAIRKKVYHLPLVKQPQWYFYDEVPHDDFRDKTKVRDMAIGVDSNVDDDDNKLGNNESNCEKTEDYMFNNFLHEQLSRTEIKKKFLRF